MSATWVDPIFTSLTASAYKAALDGDHAIAKRIVNAFNCHQQTVADLTVRVDAGALLVAGALSEIAAQTVSGFVATSANTRIDRIVLDPYTGVATRVAGTQSATPVAPAIPAGKIPLFRVGPFTTTTTQIPNSFLTDERLLGVPTEIGGIATLTDAATINWDATFPIAQVTLGGNRTLANPTNLVDGRRYSLWIIEDSTGTRTITFGTNYVFPVGIKTNLIDTTAFAENLLEGTARGGKLYCSLGKGMA
jgi:hypothetical protein